ncbi:hypothetical protein ACFB49_13090 [Sphingomonas sp. DBB INV C78]|uniref:reverse transcriptase-like protein n=1 Tax=Sphingomonas sp. DBB INV C78 TaxID=3349434 RepID=UPI0036D43DC0
MTASKRLKLYFDGGCRPNPGAMETAVVVRGIPHLQTDAGHGSNHDAEWLALLHAAHIAIASGASDVEFVGDALAVINQAKGAAKCRTRTSAAHLAEFQRLTSGFARVRIRHVARSHNLAGIALARLHSGL